MVLVGSLKLAFNCFDLLAWPLVGLGCPLYASVRAIENNSKPEMRNLVAYWILFSLVSLFELAFVRLIDWLPFWPYLKLMAVCLLVLPDFNGASYVYECLLHPCLSLDLRAAIKYFIKSMEDKNLDTESFLAALDRYIQENGSEALEKLVDRKSKRKKPDIGMEVMKAMTYKEEKETAAAIQSKYEEPNVGKVDARAAELPEKSPVSVTKLSKVKEPRVDKENANAGELKDESPAIATKQEARLATAKSNLKSPRWQVKCVQTNLAQNEKKTVTAGEIKEKTVAAVGGESKALEIIDSKKVQREWKLKASKQVNESEGFSSLFQSKHTKPDIAAEEIKAITSTGEMETGAAIQSKYEEPDVGKVDARAVGLPEESPGAAKKLSNVKEPHVVKENDNVGELKDEIPAVATGEEAKSVTLQSGHNSLLLVKCVEPNLTQYEKNTVAAEAIEEKIVAAPGGEGNKAMKITNSEKVQSEWTCALCQVTTTCEKVRDSHLQGRKHKAQELKASKQANNNTDEPNLTQYEKNTVAAEAIEEKIVAAPGGEGNKAVKITNSEKVQSEWTCALCQVTTTCEKVRDSHLQGRKHKAQELKASKQANNNTDEPNLTQYEKNTVAAEAIEEKIVAAPGGEGNKAMKLTNSEKVQCEWTCALCQVTTTCEKVRDSHLQGRKHKAQELKASKQANNNTDEPNLTQYEKIAVAAEAIEENIVGAPGGEGNKAVKITNSEKVQSEWTCALCQVTTTCEKVRDSHLQGRKHKAQELKASKQANNNTDEPNLTQYEKNTVAAEAIEEKIVAAPGGEGNKAMKITNSEKVQCEWTCALCQVTTTCEKVRDSHLQGRKHKAQELKASKQANNNTDEPNLTQYEKNTVAAEAIEENIVAAPGGEGNKAVKITNSEKVQSEWTCALCQVTTTCEKVRDSHLQGRKHKAQELKASKQANNNTDEPNLTQYEKNTVAAEAIEEKIVAAPGGERNKAMKITNSEKVQCEWTCALCQVTTTCEKVRDSHLQGRKHKAQELKASKQANNNTDEGDKETANNDGPKNSSQPQYTTVFDGNLAPEARNKETANNDGSKNSCSQPQYTTVFAGNLAPEVSQLDLLRHFHTLGAGVIEEVRIQRDKGFGFVRYSTHAEAALAIRMGNTCSMLFGKQIKCSWGSKLTPPGTSSNPLPPPVAAPMPWFSAGDVLAYEWQLAMAKMMGGGEHPLMHPQGQQHHLLLKQAAIGMDSAGASQAIYDGGFHNVAAQQLMYYQ